MAWHGVGPTLFEPLLVQHMSDPNQPPSLDDLGNRIAKARHSAGLDRSAEKEDAERSYGAGLGAAWRISIEIVVAVVVCTAIGYGVDVAFETKPWGMLIMLFLGAAAGINNAVRTAMRMDREATAALQRRNKAPDGTEPGRRKRGD